MDDGTRVGTVGTARPRMQGDENARGTGRTMSPQPAPAWSTAMVRDLKRFWKDGVSTLAIAERLGVTKGAVIGNAHRLGLPKRDPPRAIARAQHEALQREHEETAVPAALREPVDGRRRTGTYLAITPGFDVGRLKGGCRWIDGNDFLAVLKAGGDPYCGASPSGPGSPWCETHRALVFTRRAG
jgi:hypothetical protein